MVARARLVDLSASSHHEIDSIIGYIFNANDKNGDRKLSQSEWVPPPSFAGGPATITPEDFERQQQEQFVPEEVEHEWVQLNEQTSEQSSPSDLPKLDTKSDNAKHALDDKKGEGQPHAPPAEEWGKRKVKEKENTWEHDEF